MDGREWRPVGEVADVVRLGVGELPQRMEGSDLQHALVPMLAHRVIDQIEHVVEIEKILEQRRMHDQGGVHLLRIGCGEQFDLAVDILQIAIQVRRLADHVAHLFLHIHRLGERAQVEADHGLLQPVARRGNHFVR